MKKITSKQLKQLWHKFFESKGFVRIKNSSLVPENDATVLFTTAGMHPLVPYLLGEKHPGGTKLFNVQRCVRTNDIDEVGDASHCTFFEMLGNWTLGECNKTEMVENSYQFLTKWLEIPQQKLAVTVFEGDEVAPKDTETANAWKKCGLNESQIFYLPKKDNWWSLGGGVGPCGPDTEMFIVADTPKCGPNCSPACSCGKYLEIWNDVFMQYNSQKVGEKALKLPKPNIDTGMGVERTVCVLNGVKSVYDVGVFKNMIDFISKQTNKNYLENKKAFRIIVDHVRAVTFMLGDNAKLLPSNVGAGYVLRRLIRRGQNYARELDLKINDFIYLADIVIAEFGEEYPELMQNKDVIKAELKNECEKFQNTLQQGHKEFERVISNLQGNKIDGASAFKLYDTYGFPLELTKELASEKGIVVDENSFAKAFEHHQELSRMGAEQHFKGGLADQSQASANLHTATHIMLAGLRKMFGNEVCQRGSNITPERLRFDFNCDHKMTPEEIKQLEDFVNDVICKKISVVCEELSLEEAKKSGATGIFESKYGEMVKVYTIGDISKEICGGPHANNTGDLVKFTIQKEESSSSGIRRIKAIIG